jgi:GNAT superfamily N-acetyltransferase
VSVVDTKLIQSAPDHLQLLYLYVSRSVRRQGVGRKLFAEAAEAARGLGAKALYISAVPTEKTVNFYLHLGASLVAEPDPDLFAAEPDDVHLTYPVGDADERAVS